MEFYNALFDNFCMVEGIVRYHTVQNTPKQNGVEERMNQMLMQRARCIRIFANISKQFGVEAVNTG